MDDIVVESSVSTFIEITSSPIVAVIFAGGVSGVTVGVGQNLTMDPGRFSIDPDDPFALQVFNVGITIFFVTCHEGVELRLVT